MNNSIQVISPYWWKGTWVFDDDRKGLVMEPFVVGVPVMIDHLVNDIANAKDGFRLTFSDRPFPGHTHLLEWMNEEEGGNWYRLQGGTVLSGWLCPALKNYYMSIPRFLYVKAEGLCA